MPPASKNHDGAKLVFAKLSQTTKDTLRKLWADGGYAGALIDWVKEHLDAILEIVNAIRSSRVFNSCRDAGLLNAPLLGLVAIAA